LKLALVALLVTLASTASGAPLVDYRVEPGDSCANIARRRWGDAKLLRLIHANNALGPPPHHLKPGTILHLPPATTSGPDALLTFVRNLVDTFTPDRNLGKKDDPLKRGDRVGTERHASAEVTFRDQSRLQLGEQTLVVILGGATPARGNADDTTLLSGRLRAFLGQLSQPAPLAVATSSGRARLGAGEAQLSVDAAHTTRLAVYHGRSRLTAKKRTVAVNEGFGSKAELGRAPTPPRPLPAAPRLTDPPPALLLGSNELVARYRPGDGPGPAPAGWHLQVASDEQFNALALDTRVPVEVTELDAKDLAPGRWFARVSAIDADQFEGPFSSVSEVRVARVETTPSPKAGAVVVTLDGGSEPLYCGTGDQALALVQGPLELEARTAIRLRCAIAAAGEGAAELSIPPLPPPPPPPPIKKVSALPAPPPPPPPPPPEGALQLGLAGHLIVDPSTGATSGGIGVEAGSRLVLSRGSLAIGLHLRYEQLSTHDALPSANAASIGVFVRYYFRATERRINPYLALRPSLLLLSAEPARDGNRAGPAALFALAGLGGLEARLSPAWAAFAELGYRGAFSPPPQIGSRASGLELGLGLRFTPK
jgi:hypothetical protein